MPVTTEPAATTADDTTLVDTSCSATISAPIEKVDIPSWCFSLPDSEYRACSPSHDAAGATTAPDGRSMSINVEVVGGTLIAQHYVEEIAERFPLGSVHADRPYEDRCDAGAERYEDRQRVVRTHEHVPQFCATRDARFPAVQGLAFDAFRIARRPNSEDHNRQETPSFAKSIGRHALANK